jgi:hypothetical protein
MDGRAGLSADRNRSSSRALWAVGLVVCGMGVPKWHSHPLPILLKTAAATVEPG